MSKKQHIILSLLCLVGAFPVFAAEPVTGNEPKIATETASKSSLEIGSSGSYLSGQFARQRGDVDGAVALLSDALEQNPDNVEMLSQLLSVQVAKGDMPSALSTSKRLQELRKKDPLAGLVLLVTQVKQGNYATAHKQLADTFETSGGQLWLPLVEAWLDAGEGNIKRALTIEEMPVTVGRAASVMNYQLALINIYAGFNDQAAINFADAVEEPESAPTRVMQQLQVFYSKHADAQALKDIIEQYKAAHPNDLPPLESPITSPADGIAEVLYTMGSVMQIAGVQHDSIIYMQLAHYVRPDFHLVSFNLAEVLAESGAYERATNVLRAIPTTSQYTMKGQLRQAMILDRIGKSAEALDVLAKLAAAHPKIADIWIAKGDLLRVHHRFLEAHIAYGEAITRIGEPSEKDWPVFYARGACLERLGKWKDAKADLRKSLELNPDQPDVLNYLGYGLLTHDNGATEAKTMIEKAIALSPDDPQIVDSMGWTLYTLGQYKEALPYLERAVELLPGDATVNDHLGDNYWRLGRKSEARFQWERALTFDPEEPDIKKIHAKIEGGLPEVKLPQTKSAAADNASNATP